MNQSDPYKRPGDMSDDLVRAVGNLSEAFECVERVRGKLYDMHQLAGHADLLFGKVADELEEAGAKETATQVRQQVVGRNVVNGRWTFQLVDEFNDQYYKPIKKTVKQAEADLQSGKTHVFEAEMKEDRVQGKDPDSHSSRPR